MYSFEFLTSKVSDAVPCGPDLDLVFDDTFMQFMATIESILPDSSKPGTFFEFDRVGAQLPKKIEGMKGLLETTRDLRLLSALAKLQILERQTEHFITTLKAIDFLVAERWQDVHPQAEDGDYTLRINSLEALDDFTQVVLPVQHSTLFKSRRSGPITYRAYLLANGTIQPREIRPDEFEPKIEQGSFDAIIEGSNESSANDVDIREMIQSREQFTALKAALTGIQDKSQEFLDYQGSIKFERLLVLTNDIVAFLEKAITRRDPTMADASAPEVGEAISAGDTANGAQSGGSAIPSGPVTSLAEVTLALRAVGNYFSRFEPSSPALLLVRQAQGLVGRGFFDALRALMPAHASEANLLLGATPGFDMNIERLAEVAGEYAAQEEPAAEDTAPEEEASTEYSGGEDAGDEIATENEAADHVAEDLADDPPSVSAEMHARPDVRAGNAKVFSAKSRQEAIGLLNAVQKYYVQVEPSSPIPLLIERARVIGSLEFSSLLKLVMPKEAFRRRDDD